MLLMEKTGEVSVVLQPRSIEAPYEHYVSTSHKYHVRLTRTRLIRHVSTKTALALNEGELTGSIPVYDTHNTIYMTGEFICVDGDLPSSEVPYLHGYSHQEYQHVLLEIRADSAIEDVSLNFIFPDVVKYPDSETACKRGKYPAGFAELYNSKWGVLPPLPKNSRCAHESVPPVLVSNTGLWQDYDGIQCNDRVTCIVEKPDGTKQYTKSTGDAVVRIHDEIGIKDAHGMYSAHDDVYQSIVQVPLGNWGVDMRVVTAGAVLIHRYWFKDEVK